MSCTQRKETQYLLERVNSGHLKSLDIYALRALSYSEATLESSAGGNEEILNNFIINLKHPHLYNAF